MIKLAESPFNKIKRRKRGLGGPIHITCPWVGQVQAPNPFSYVRLTQPNPLLVGHK